MPPATGGPSYCPKPGNSPWKKYNSFLNDPMYVRSRCMGVWVSGCVGVWVEGGGKVKEREYTL